MEPIWIAVAAAAAVLVVILLLRAGRGRERVIDMGGSPAVADGTVARRDGEATAARSSDAISDKPAAGSLTAGELLELQGKDDPECGLADWLMEDASSQLGVDLSSDRMALTRLAEAALKASADLKATGRASIQVEYLYADAGGPKHYRREVMREEAEVGMIFHGALLVDELLQWRGRDVPTRRLGEWLQDELDEDASDKSLDVVVVQRLADATELALVDIARSGRAVVDLPGLQTLDDDTFHFRREIDRAKLDEILAEG
jgi:hypothetical protein